MLSYFLQESFLKNYRKKFFFHIFCRKVFIWIYGKNIFFRFSKRNAIFFRDVPFPSIHMKIFLTVHLYIFVKKIRMSFIDGFMCVPSLMLSIFPCILFSWKIIYFIATEKFHIPIWVSLESLFYGLSKSYFIFLIVDQIWKISGIFSGTSDSPEKWSC